MKTILAWIGGLTLAGLAWLFVLDIINQREWRREMRRKGLR